MSASRTNQWKLGLFVTLGVLTALGTLLWLGADAFRQDSITFYTVLDESVHGMDIGSPVKYRGVTVGVVADIDFLPDGRLILVAMSVYQDTLQALGLRPVGIEGAGARREASHLAVQLASAGITGGKYLSADIFDPERFPRLEVPRPLPDAVTDDLLVPSVASGFKSLEDLLYSLTESLPTLIQDVNSSVQHISDLSSTVRGLAQGEVKALLMDATRQLEALDLATISARVVESLGQIDATLADVNVATRRFLDEDRPRLRELVESVMRLSESLDQAVAEAQVEQTGASLRSALDRAGSAAEEATTLMSGLEGDRHDLLEQFRLTAAELRRALEQVAMLADLLERDPGVLLRGRASADQPPRNP